MAEFEGYNWLVFKKLHQLYHILKTFYSTYCYIADRK